MNANKQLMIVKMILAKIGMILGSTIIVCMLTTVFILSFVKISNNIYENKLEKEKYSQHKRLETITTKIDELKDELNLSDKHEFIEYKDISTEKSFTKNIINLYAKKKEITVIVFDFNTELTQDEQSERFDKIYEIAGKCLDEAQLNCNMSFDSIMNFPYVGEEIILITIRTE